MCYYPPIIPPNSAICRLIEVFKLMAKIVFKKDTANAPRPSRDRFSTCFWIGRESAWKTVRTRHRKKSNVRILILQDLAGNWIGARTVVRTNHIDRISPELHISFICFNFVKCAVFLLLWEITYFFYEKDNRICTYLLHKKLAM